MSASSTYVFKIFAGAFLQTRNCYHNRIRAGPVWEWREGKELSLSWPSPVPSPSPRYYLKRRKKWARGKGEQARGKGGYINIKKPHTVASFASEQIASVAGAGEAAVAVLAVLRAAGGVRSALVNVCGVPKYTFVCGGFCTQCCLYRMRSCEMALVNVCGAPITS